MQYYFIIEGYFMSYARLGLLISAGLLSSSVVLAGGEPDDRLAALEKRLAYLEQRVKSQDAVIAEKNEAISKLTGSALGRTELLGVIEMSTADTQGSGTAGQVDKVELTLSTEINENISSEIVLLSEADDDGNLSTVEFDTAAVTFSIPDTKATITTGKFGHSFASLESAMVSDPLTKTEGDVSSNMGVELATYLNGMGITLAGTADGQAAATVSVGGETADMEYSFNAGYTNELAGSTTTVGGYTFGTTVAMAGITMNAEYLEADDKKSGDTHEINASHIDFSADLGPGTAFIGYGETRSGLGVTTDQAGVGYHYDLGDGVTLSYEHLENTDNNDVDTLKLAVEF
jgi:hypothetical protein